MGHFTLAIAVGGLEGQQEVRMNCKYLECHLEVSEKNLGENCEGFQARRVKGESEFQNNYCSETAEVEGR